MSGEPAAGTRPSFTPGEHEGGGKAPNDSAGRGPPPSFTLPMGLVGASLLFWGWETGNLPIAVPLALVVEAFRHFELRFDLELPRYNQLADLCTVAFVALAAILLANRGVPHGVLNAFQYLPAVLTPILLAQYAASGRRIHLSSLFRYLRKLKAREPATKDPLIDLSGAYLAITLLAAGMANQRGPTYYFAVLGFLAWALCARRPAHASIAAWAALFTLAAAFGYAGQHGLNQLQGFLEDWVSDWHMRQSTNTDRASTDLGTIGRLKQFDAILLRVYAPETAGERIRLLHRASYNVFTGTIWHVRNAPLAPMQAGADGSTWILADAEARHAVRMAAKSESGRTLLALPAGTARVTDLVANAVRQNEFGGALAEAPEPWLRYQAHFGESIGHYASPLAEDVALPRLERDVVERIADSIGLRGLRASEAAQRVREYLGGFRYSLYREAPPADGATPIGDFLTRTKSGHCEYFAAATVLLLRAAGVPARYATGYAALEYSDLEGAWVVRARHAHAWTRAFIDGRWVDVDTTPPSWFAEESETAPAWQPLADFFRWAFFRWSQRGESTQASDWWYVLAGVLFLILAWRIVKGRRAAVAQAPGAGTALRAWQGEDSEFYALERAIAAAHGPRARSETFTAWLARVQPGEEIRQCALAALALHQRYRFDPQALPTDERSRLRSAVAAALQRIQGAGAAASRP